MFHKILLALVVVQLPPSAAAQAQLPALGDRSGQLVAAALDRMINGDPEGAVAVLRSTAMNSTIPVEVLRAKCIIAAALVMNGEFRSAEEGVGIINNPMGAAPQAAWKQALPDCVQRLEAIAPRMEAERKAAVYYFLGIVGSNEVEHLRYLREALKARPNFTEASYQLAAHLMALGQLDEAAAMFRKVAEQRPDWAEARNNIGVALTLSGRPAEAIREFQEAIKIDPEFVDAHGQLGLAYYAAGDFDNAMNECARAIRGVADNPLYHNCAALVLLEKDRPGDAVAYARRASQLAPGHETFQVVLAAALQASGQQAEALEVMRRAAAAEPRLLSEPTRLEKAHLLRSRALAFARQILLRLGPAATPPPR